MSKEVYCGITSGTDTASAAPAGGASTVEQTAHTTQVQSFDEMNDQLFAKLLLPIPQLTFTLWTACPVLYWYTNVK